MSDRRHPIPQMDELREGFRALGEREATAPPASWWRRRLGGPRRAVGAGVVAVELVGTAASATQWISLGGPERKAHPDAPRYQPGSAKPVLAVTAPDAAVGLPWGVAIFDSRSGERCAFVGQVRGSTLGVVRDGRFRPFAGPTSAACSALARPQVMLSFKTFPTTPRRTLVYGRAGAGVAKVRLRVGRGARVTAVGPGGSYLFVLDGDVEPEAMVVDGLDADGRRALGQRP